MTTTINPFAVQTPESMTPAEVVELFEPVPDVNAINSPGHTFIHGQRGSGKSMLLRWLSPECVMLAEKVDATKLPFLSVYLSIKQAQLDLPELKRLEGLGSGAVLSEHLLVCLLIVKVLDTWKSIFSSQLRDEHTVGRFRESLEKKIVPRFRACGWKDIFSSDQLGDGVKICEWLQDTVDLIHVETIAGFVQRLGLESEPLRWSGPLLGYQTVLLPLIRELKSLPGIPENLPVFILLDDADNLNIDQTKVLNSWVAQRTTEFVSLKISTQMRYKTLLTHSNNGRIDAPHDFSEIFLTSVQVGGGGSSYENWLTSVLTKRLQKFGLDVAPYALFPEDAKQVAAIEEIKNSYRSKAKEDGPRGYRANDDVYRYSRPDYMAQISGNAKGSYRYSYSGLTQLLHLSSGIIRFFLDPAARMFSEQLKRNGDQPVTAIDPDIQNQVLREMADNLIFQELDKMRQDAAISSWLTHTNDLLSALKKLKNLVEALGATFRLILLDKERSERRVFSILLNDEPTDEANEIIKLGILLGYFQEASIGAKDGLGRTRRVVLTRRLAPYFNLDPIGFSGYLSVTSEFLQRAIHDPHSVRGRIKSEGVDSFTQQTQLDFSFEGAS